MSKITALATTDLDVRVLKDFFCALKPKKKSPTFTFKSAKLFFSTEVSK